MAEIVIRGAEGAADIATLRELMSEYAGHLRSAPAGAANICIENFAEEMADLPGPYVCLLLAEVDGHAAGCVVLKRLSARGEPACDLKRLWVRDSFRGLRLGRRLVLAALDWAAARGYEAVYLDTVPAAMPAANRLYASLGFQPVERYSDNPVPDVVFFRRGLKEGAEASGISGNLARY